jgi:hypothetical protein
MDRSVTDRRRLYLTRLAACMIAVVVFIQPVWGLASDYFGALAYDAETGAHGWSTDYADREDAAARALGECWIYGAQCEIVATIENACAAMGKSNQSNAHGWAQASNLTGAVEGALASCVQNGAKAGSCDIIMQICPLP